MVFKPFGTTLLKDTYFFVYLEEHSSIYVILLHMYIIETYKYYIYLNNIRIKITYINQNGDENKDTRDHYY